MGDSVQPRVRAPSHRWPSLATRHTFKAASTQTVGGEVGQRLHEQIQSCSGLDSVRQAQLPPQETLGTLPPESGS